MSKTPYNSSPASIQLVFQFAAEGGTQITSGDFPPLADAHAINIPASNRRRIDRRMGEDENGDAPKQVLYPTSIRITETEKKWIDVARGDLSISDYFRSLVQVAYSVSPDMRKRRRREPVKNQAELAHALALLGRSRLFSNLAQATEHLNKGTWFCKRTFRLAS